MHTAVGKITVHTVDLCKVFGTAYRAHIHFQFFMAAVVTVSQRKVDTLIIAKLHSSADQCTDRLLIIADRVAHILDFSAVAQFPESAFQILFLNRSHILCYMAVEAVA